MYSYSIRFSHDLYIYYMRIITIISSVSEYCTLVQPKKYVLINVTMIWQMRLHL